MDVFELIRHADEVGNLEDRRRVDILDLERMGLEVSQLVRQRRAGTVMLDKERDKARRKARKLLRRSLTAAQWKEFLKGKSFHMTGSDERLYRIEHRISGNVILVVDGQDAARYCLVPKGDVWIPEPDMMLAVKLMLETNAMGFLRRANRTDLRPNRLRRTG